MLLKILKKIFLLFVLSLFIISGVLLQTSLALRNTLFSESYFAKSFDKNNMDSNIAKLVTDTLANAETFVPAMAEGKNSDQKKKPVNITPEAQKQIDSFKKMLKDNIDMQWIRVEMPKTIKGLHGYFLAGSGKLPVVNIKPLKEAYVGLFAQSVIKNSGKDALKEVNKTAAAVKNLVRKHSKDGLVNDKVIDETMKLKHFKTMNMSREATGRVAGKMAGSDKVKAEELLNYSVTEMIKDRIDFYQIKDKLDLDLFFETKYGNKDNPVSGIADLISAIKFRELLLVSILFILLFIIIAVTVFSARGILRWSGVGMVLSGIICIMSFTFARLVDAKIISNFEGLSKKAKGIDLLFAQKYILSYVGGVWKYIFIQALIFIIMGIIFIAASFYVHRLFKKSAGESSKKLEPISNRRKTLLLRVAVILLLLMAIPLNAAINIYGIKTSVNQYNKTKEIAAKSAKENNKALGIVLNAQKFMDMMQGEKGGSGK